LLRAGEGQLLAQDVEQAAHPRHVHLEGRRVDRPPVRGHLAGSDAPGGSGAMAGRPSTAARIRSGLAGRSAIHAPVASAIAAPTAGAPTSIGSSPTPLAPCGAPLNGASTRIVEIRGASSEGGMMAVGRRAVTLAPA